MTSERDGYVVAGLQLANFRRTVEAMTAEDVEHSLPGRGRTAHQQSAAGLRVGEQGALPVGDAVGELHFAAIACPVALARAGDMPAPCQFVDAGPQRQPSTSNLGRQRR